MDDGELFFQKPLRFEKLSTESDSVFCITQSHLYKSETKSLHIRRLGYPTFIEYLTQEEVHTT